MYRPNIGWSLNRPPEVPFTINYNSPQADGLLGFWTALASPFGGKVKELYFGYDGTVGANGTWQNNYLTPELYSAAYYAIDHGNYAIHDFASKNYSVFLRINIPSIPTAGQADIFRRQSGSGGWGIQTLTSNRFRLTHRAAVDGSADWNSATLTGVHDYVTTYDNSATSATLYRDGISLGSTGLDSCLTYSGSMFSYGGADAPIAFIDMRIYDHILSADEVWHLSYPVTKWDLYLPVIKIWPVISAVPVVAEPIPLFTRHLATLRGE